MAIPFWTAKFNSRQYFRLYGILVVHQLSWLLWILNLCNYWFYEQFILNATALTHDNVLNELKELDWWTLKGIFGVLKLPESEGQRIERMFLSEEERKSAGVLWWLDHHPLASWRLLITRLDKKRKHSLANRIHQYAEKVTGMLSSVLYYHWQLYNFS